MKWLLAMGLLVACGDNNSIFIDAAAPDAPTDLFGESCEQPPFPEIGICHEGEGACHDEAGGSVCRPFCHVDGVAQCMARGGVEQDTDRGACVCVPP